jgi:hypothetical protein
MNDTKEDPLIAEAEGFGIRLIQRGSKWYWRHKNVPYDEGDEGPFKTEREAAWDAIKCMRGIGYASR